MLRPKSNAFACLSAMPGEIIRVEPFVDCGVIARAIWPLPQLARSPAPLEMQSQSSNVSAVFVLIHVQAALATSMVSSKPPSV
jgi:hypothetical protein